MEGQYHCHKFDMVKSTYANFVNSLNYGIPSHTIISTIDGHIIHTESQIKEELINQLTTQVNFVKCILKASENCGNYIELGGNDIFTDILKDTYAYFQLK
jgi:malonyl CoA-acyl carrier protein transacylase